MPSSPPRWLVLVCLVGAMLLISHEIALLPDGKAHAHILDVGQGDSILLVSPTGKQVLVDGGPDLSTLEYLGNYMPFFDRSIDLIILTHPHEDHLAALPEVLKRYRVGQIILAGTESSNSRYRSMLEEVTKQKVAVILPDPDKDIDLGNGMVLDVLWPDLNSPLAHSENANNSSVAIRVLYGDESIVLTGDIETEVENAILESGAELESNIVKVAHHGSRTSSSSGFIKATSATEAVISVGEVNSFGHPNLDVIDRWKSFGVDVSLTSEVRTVSYTFSGPSAEE